VLIVVCDNTDIAEVFYRNISGEETVEVVDGQTDDNSDVNANDRANEDADESADEAPVRSKKPKTKTVYGTGKLFSEYFSNTADRRYTLRIDTKLLAEAES
jgi:type III restriction enzyme